MGGNGKKHIITGGNGNVLYTTMGMGWEWER